MRCKSIGFRGRGSNSFIKSNYVFVLVSVPAALLVLLSRGSGPRPLELSTGKKRKKCNPATLTKQGADRTNADAAGDTWIRGPRRFKGARSGVVLALVIIAVVRPVPAAHASL